jgi:fumarate hydratase subunit beta
VAQRFRPESDECIDVVRAATDLGWPVLFHAGCGARPLGPAFAGLIDRRGLGPQADCDESDALRNSQPLLAELYGASISGRAATGPRAGRPIAKVGDAVEITGTLFTGRDAVHKYLHEGGQLPPGVSLRDGIIYHCGHVVLKQDDGSWRATAAGPTTSIREEPYQAQIIRDFGVRGVIGKGGMGAKTLAACRESGAVYLHAVGGAAQVLADTVTAVEGVHLREKFGSPEAIWVFRVLRFPAVVTMDAHGNSLHARVLAESEAALQRVRQGG